jgi:hypothetical protein
MFFSGLATFQKLGDLMVAAQSAMGSGLYIHVPIPSYYVIGIMPDFRI